MIRQTAIILAALAGLASARAATNDCTPETRSALNAQVREQLAAAGDTPEVRRPTEFYFYGLGDPLETLTASLGARGFTVQQVTSPGLGIIATKNLSMEPVAFDALTVELCTEADKLKIEFDGWVTSPVK